jgi:thiamine biosynthesis protein ThiS
MRLKVNGEKIDDIRATNLEELLEELDIDSRRVAVELNDSIVRKSEYEKTELNDGDSVEIVNFVGGG